MRAFPVVLLGAALLAGCSTTAPNPPAALAASAGTAPAPEAPAFAARCSFAHEPVGANEVQFVGGLCTLSREKFVFAAAGFSSGEPAKSASIALSQIRSFALSDTSYLELRHVQLQTERGLVELIMRHDEGLGYSNARASEFSSQLKRFGIREGRAAKFDIPRKFVFAP